MSETADDPGTPQDPGTALSIARAAAADAERSLGEVAGRLASTEDQLAVASAAQADWDRLSAELTEELRQTRDRLDAIESSRTWRLTQGSLAPYRFVRGRLGR